MSVYGSPANGWSVEWSNGEYDSYPAFHTERWLCHNGPMSDEATPRMKGRCVGRALERQYWLKQLRRTLGGAR